VIDDRATTLVILISGRFRIRFSNEPGDEVVLVEQGNYVIWGAGIDHTWGAEEDSVVLTIRWPSLTDRSRSAPKPSVSNAT
jgi:quercetin dioxygenase-like cupin family protein